MKKINKALVLLFIVLFIFTNTAFAAGEVETTETTEITVEAGVTPDSFLYTFDQLFEDLQLALTFDSEKEAELLLQFAEERLSEAKTMTEEEKDEFVQEAIADYMSKLEEAQEIVTEIVLDEETEEEVVDSLTENLEEIAEVDDEIEECLNEEDKAELEEKTDTAYLVASVVKDLDQEEVISLRESGLGYGQIAQVFLLAEHTGKSVEEVGELFSEDSGLGDVAKELGVQPSELSNTIKEKKKEKNQFKEEKGTDEDTDIDKEEDADTDLDKDEDDDTDSDIDEDKDKDLDKDDDNNKNDKAQENKGNDNGKKEGIKKQEENKNKENANNNNKFSNNDDDDDEEEDDSSNDLEDDNDEEDED